MSKPSKLTRDQVSQAYHLYYEHEQQSPLPQPTIQSIAHSYGVSTSTLFYHLRRECLRRIGASA